jgi:hypothetical protein
MAGPIASIAHTYYPLSGPFPFLHQHTRQRRRHPKQTNSSPSFLPSSLPPCCYAHQHPKQTTPHHTTQHNTDGGAVPGLQHGAVHAHGGQGQAHRGASRSLSLYVYRYRYIFMCVCVLDIYICVCIYILPPPPLYLYIYTYVYILWRFDGGNGVLG